MFSTRFISATKAYSTFTEFIPAPQMRRTFTLDEIPASVTVTICGLGFYDLYVNGTRLTKGAGILAPYVSNPDDILYYDKYDLTPYLCAGKNVLALRLGNGMLNCPGGEIWDFQTARYRSAPKVALAVEAGDTLLFEADERFVTCPSPIYYDDLRVGEFYNATKETPGWELPDYKDGGWVPALPAETPRGVCRLCEAEPIVATGEITPVAIRRASIGATNYRSTLPVIEGTDVEKENEGWLYDFGVNAAGLCRLKVRGRRGQKIVLQFGEKLDRNGDLDLSGMSFLPRAFNHRDIYICKGGDEDEIWMPTFTYHGFRYVLVLGLRDEQATPELLTYVVMNSDLKTRGGFTCSDELLNRIQSAVRVSDLANFYYFPTDCPHREKNGWTADAALSAEQMMLNFTPENSYREWLHNIRKAQREDGAIPGIIPTSGWGFAWGNGPAWDCIMAYLPYFIYKYRGDLTPLRENAEMLIRYINYVTTRRDRFGLIHIGLGDWCHAARSGGPKAPLELTDTLMCMDITAKSAALFKAAGMEPQRLFAQSVYDGFRAAAREHLIDFGTMTALGGCQASQAMGIFYDLFDEAEKPEAFRVLIDMIEADGRVMDVGVLGGRVLFRVLSAYGRTDLAYELITTDRYPSYALWFRQDATALWESFYPESRRPASCNHHFWGDVSGWMYENLAGLHVNPGLRDPNEVNVLPRIIPQIDSVSAHYDAPAGRIEVSWARDGEDVILTLTVPEGVYGKLQTEQAWKLENGVRYLPLRSGKYRLIPAAKRDNKFQPNV